MSLYETFRERLARHEPVALATIISGPSAVGAKLLICPEGAIEGDVPGDDLREPIVEDARRLLRAEVSDTVSYTTEHGIYDVFIDAYPVPARLVIVGASAAAAPLTTFAKALGYQVTVMDARGAFISRERFPEADEVLKGWPQEVLPGLSLDAATFVVLLSHDRKFDEPTLHHVLRTEVPYVGAIGSRKTQRERFERLREQGFSEEQLARVYGPVGLDIGSRTPEETALAILAEITAVRYGKSGRPLRERA